MISNFNETRFSALNTCSVELLLKVGTLLPELAVHEKSVDHFIELLRKDQLDENSSVEPLEKSINYFQVFTFTFTSLLGDGRLQLRLDKYNVLQ